MAQGYVTRRGKMWYAFWVDSEGNARSKSVSMQESEARLFLERRKMEVELARKHDCEAVLFEQAAEDFIARVLPTAYKPSTVVNMTSDLRAHLIPFFKDAYVCEISARDLDSFIAERIIDDGASFADEGLAKEVAGPQLRQDRLVAEEVRAAHLHRAPEDHADFPHRPARLEQRLAADHLRPARVQAAQHLLPLRLADAGKERTVHFFTPFVGNPTDFSPSV